MIDFYQLEHLLAIADAGTLSKAAENLSISQPALSRSIQRLEDELHVTLFDRKKNKITLNETGQFALDYARNIVTEANDMIIQVQKHAQRNQIIHIGACAPAPLWSMKWMMKKVFPEMKTTIALDAQELALLEGLKQHTYTIIVLHHPIDIEEYACIKLFDEHLYLSVPPAHPLAFFKDVKFRDLNGESVLLLSKIGIWNEICLKMIPDSHLLIQQDTAVFNELTNASALPYFRTNLTMSRNENKNPRVSLRILDPEASLSFYAVYHKKDKPLFASLNTELQSIDWDKFEAL